MKKYLSRFMALSLALGFLTGCSDNNGNSDDTGSSDNTESSSSESTTNADKTDGSTENPETANAPTEADFSATDADMFTDRDRRTDYDKSKAIKIKLDGTSATADSDSVDIDGSTVTITEEATYIISGTLTDGMLVVDAPDTAKLQLVFDGVDITSKTSAALCVLEADKVFVTLADGSSNSLSNGGSFTAIDDNNIDGTVFSKQDLTLNGSGSLTVTSPAGHGIVCKDDLVFTGGDYTITSSSDGMDVNDSVRITDADITVDAGKDAVYCENTDDTSLGYVYVSGGSLTAEAEGDGIDANAYIQITGGKFNLLTGGGSEKGSKTSSGNFMGRGHGGMNFVNNQNTATTEKTTSTKGIKADNSILISDGDFKINSADDSIHSDISVTIDGGTFEIASGDDAVHAEENLTVNAGNINITESYEGLEALNVAVNGGDITLVASDDGLNAAGGSDSSGTAGGRDGMFGGGHGGMDGKKPDRDFQNGERPDFPDVEMPDGEKPEMPDGEKPEIQNGERPEFPDGERSEFPGGEMPEMPDGGMFGGGHGGMGGGMSSGNGSIVISGGNIHITASGDGIDANGTLEITGGNIIVEGPTQGDTATLDYDKTGIITGGTFIGSGASNMAQTFSSSEQGVITIKTSNQPAGTSIVLKDESGKTIIEHTPDLSFEFVILSSPDIVSGDTYTVTVGSTTSESVAD